jgi:hypothetical protein
MSSRSNLAALGRIAHAASLYVAAAAALAALAATVLAALGVVPWLTLEARFGATPLPEFGTYLQVGLTALLWLLLGTIPSGARMLALERSHRDFRITMEDVANAYHMAHVGDRKGAFRLSSEFDAVRERLEYLRDHPDLRLLEADVLTLAAQMSRQSHKLAEIYSDERVARAKDFLRQRQQEAEAQQARIVEALAVAREIGRWSSQVELEEAVVASQLQSLDEQLQAVLPALGYNLDRPAQDPDAAAEAEDAAHGVEQGAEARRLPNVVPMGTRPAAE